jgi:hypothetical protein
MLRSQSDSRTPSAVGGTAGNLQSAGGQGGDYVRVPAPTAWPIVLAFGVTLIFAGLVTSESVTVAGTLLAVVAAVGWFRDVLPEETHELVCVLPALPAAPYRRREVAHVAVRQGLNRARLPLEIYPVAAGIRGGLAGAVVMAMLAMAYGIASGNSVWYAINLLAVGFFPGAARLPAGEMGAFSASSILIATAIHLLAALLVGVLYGAMLPMLPRHPIVLGGFVAPLAWSALLHSVLGLVNPVMNQRIDWFWFVLSQIGFGIVAGVVVSRQERVPTWQQFPLAVRAGIEAPGLVRERDGESRP